MANGEDGWVGNRQIGNRQSDFAGLSELEESGAGPAIQAPSPGAMGRWHIGLTFEHDMNTCALAPNATTTRLFTTLIFDNLFIAACIGAPLAVLLLYTNAPAALPVTAGILSSLIVFPAANWACVHAFRYQRARGPVLEYKRAPQMLAAPRLNFSIRADETEAFHLVQGTYHDEKGHAHHRWQLFIERTSGGSRFVLIYSFQKTSSDDRAIEHFAHEVGRIPVKHTSAPFHTWFKLDRKHGES